MRDTEPANYLGERIRELLATGEGQLGVQVEITDESVILRGPVDSEQRRIDILATVATHAGGRRVIDELDASTRDDVAQLRNAERIEP